MIQSPQGFVVAQECRKVSWDNGYRRPLGEAEGWARYGSTTARGDVHLAAYGPTGPWLLALENPAVVAELEIASADLPGPGIARYAFPALGLLYAALSRAYALGASLPDAPLETFRVRTASLPLKTETEYLAVQRVGQDIFRDSLLAYWSGRCPLTGIAEPALLRASHIIPWSCCATDAERLDVHNGLLLSALWDAAFDAGLVTFGDDGIPIFTPSLSGQACASLPWTVPLALTPAHRERLAWHRVHVFAALP